MCLCWSAALDHARPGGLHQRAAFAVHALAMGKCIGNMSPPGWVRFGKLADSSAGVSSVWAAEVQLGCCRGVRCDYTLRLWPRVARGRGGLCDDSCDL